MSSNVKVDLNRDEIMEGEQLILTLKDQNLLNGNELNDEDTILENLELKQQELLQQRKKEMEKIKKKNDKYGAKFEDLDENCEKKLLAHYDNDKVEKDGFFIDEEGKILDSKVKQLEQISNKLKKQKDNKIDLFFEDKIASDYRPQDKIKTTLTKRTIKKPSGQQSLISFLEENVQEPSKQEEQRGVQTVQRRDGSNFENYNEALRKAQLETDQAKQRNTILFDDDDELIQLQRSLEIKMRVQQKSNLVKKEMKNEEKLKEMLDKNSKMEFDQQQKQEDIFQKPRSKVEKNPEKQQIVMISQSTDFLQNVKTDMELQENNLRINAPTPFSVKDSREGTMSIINVSLPTERLVGFTRRQQNYESQRLDVDSYLAKEELQEIEKAKEEVNFLQDARVGVGLSNALQTLRDRGFLNEENYDYVGRANDKKVILKPDPNQKREVALEYRDASGRLMTQKEAFRYQCWKFHGKGPGKNKIEKRKRIDLMREKIKSQAPDKTPLMQTLQNEQKKANQAYMILSSKRNT